MDDNMNNILYPWASRLALDAEDLIHEALLDCQECIDNLSKKEQFHKTRSTKILSEIKDCMNKIKLDLKNEEEEVLKEIENLLKKSSNWCKQLGKRLPVLLPSPDGLLQDASNMQNLASSLCGEYNARKSMIEEVQRNEHNIIKKLNFKPKIINMSPLLNEIELEEYRNHVQNLEKILNERSELHRSTKYKVLKTLAALDNKPTHSFLNTLLQEDDEHFILSDENMKQLYKLVSFLQTLREEEDSNKNGLKERISTLYLVLDIDKHCLLDNSLITTRELKEELKSCEELRKKNMKALISKYKKKLIDLYLMCAIPKEEQTLFNKRVADDDLLSKYIREENRLRRHFDENKCIFDSLNKREDLLKKLFELQCGETMNSDGNRLKNRGCQLLKEEKERRKLEKLIKALDNEILTLAMAYEEAKKRPFNYLGEPVKQFLNKGKELRSSTSFRRSKSAGDTNVLVNRQPAAIPPNKSNAPSNENKTYETFVVGVKNGCRSTLLLKKDDN